MKALKFIAAIILLWPALAHATFDSSCTGTFTPAGGYQNGCATGVKSTATACWPGGLCDSPTGVMPPAGDICIAVLKNALTTATISTVPSNWNLIHAFNGGGTTESVAFYWYLATGSEGATYSPVFAWSSGAAVTTEIVCFSGDNTTSPIDANNTSGVFLGSTGATSINVTALATLAQNGDDLLLTASSRSGTVTFSGPTSPYSVVHVTGFFSGSTLDSATWQGNNGASTTPPNSTVQTVTQSGSSVAMSGYALALAPATGPTATPTLRPRARRRLPLRLQQPQQQGRLQRRQPRPPRHPQPRQRPQRRHRPVLCRVHTAADRDADCNLDRDADAERHGNADRGDISRKNAVPSRANMVVGITLGRAVTDGNP